MADIIDPLTGETLFREPSARVIPEEFQDASILSIYQVWASELGVASIGTDIVLTGGNDDTAVTGELALNVGQGQSNAVTISSEGMINFYNTLSPAAGSGRTGNVSYNIPSGVDPGGNITRAYFATEASPTLSLFYRPTRTIDGVISNVDNDIRIRSTTDAAIFYVQQRDFSGNFLQVAIRVSSNGSLDFFAQRTAGSAPQSEIGFITNRSESPFATPVATNDGTVFFPLNGNNLTYVAIDAFVVLAITGTVQDGVNNPIIRRVSAIEQESKLIRSTVMSAADGTYSLPVDPDMEYIVVCEDMGENPRNALVFDRVRGA